jgi:hypothetical protein
VALAFLIAVAIFAGSLWLIVATLLRLRRLGSRLAHSEAQNVNGTCIRRSFGGDLGCRLPTGGLGRVDCEGTARAAP